jgi:hypothetical protein
MASFNFLKIHPILSSDYFGGKGKPGNLNHKSFIGLFFKQLAEEEDGYRMLDAGSWIPAAENFFNLPSIFISTSCPIIRNLL